MLNPHLRDADLRGAAAPRTPGADVLGASRPSRAERRRDGLLPQSEDPLLRRPSGPPPGGGRRRSDAGPLTPARDTGPVLAGRDAGPAAGSAPAPRAVPPVSGPMTAATPASTVPPRASARPVPPRPTPAAGPAARRPDGDRPEPTTVPPRPSGASAWSAAPATPDVTQRVSGAAPAESAWGAMAAEAPVAAPRSAPPRSPQIAPRAADRAAPAGSAAPARPLVDRPAADRPGAERRDDERMRTDETALVSVVDGESPARRPVDVPVGGRAAARLERQAAEAAARKAGGRRTAPPAAPAGGRGPGREDDAAAPGAPRRAVQGVLAVVVVALVVLGVWSFTSPRTSEIAAQTPVTSAPALSALPPPPLPSLAPVTTEAPVPPAPVKAPITVLNSTNITGLAARIGDAFTAGGWEVLDTGAYPGDDIAATTVFFTAGDTEQQQAALQLVEQFGADVTGPVERFFDVEGVADPGIVVVATGNWKP
ncbi:LytR C-terminal domain-containing protein [Modestobacter sp. SSW1-42]|uniref:LytR C-terminal domain-containing protein n=1 Tax=Modestobacter sp. SSW1-42 TaxID=596372 RepID=UPI0039865B33